MEGVKEYKEIKQLFKNYKCEPSFVEPKHHLMLLFTNGGVKNIVDYFVKKASEPKYKNIHSDYYSYESRHFLESVNNGDITDKGFETFILTTPYLQINVFNYKKLKELNLLDAYEHFYGDYSGDIIGKHEILDMVIIESKNEYYGTYYFPYNQSIDKSHFYSCIDSCLYRMIEAKTREIEKFE